VEHVVLLERDGSALAGRSVASDKGRLQFRMTATGRTLFGPGVGGWMTGTAEDMGTGLQSPRPVRIVFENTRLGGSVGGTTVDPRIDISFGLGEVSGRIVFQDDAGRTSRCTAVSWQMNPERLP
jgi:hypothetical protein